MDCASKYVNIRAKNIDVDHDLVQTEEVMASSPVCTGSHALIDSKVLLCVDKISNI